MVYTAFSTEVMFRCYDKCNDQANYAFLFERKLNAGEGRSCLGRRREGDDYPDQLDVSSCRAVRRITCSCEVSCVVDQGCEVFAASVLLGIIFKALSTLTLHIFRMLKSFCMDYLEVRHFHVRLT